MAQTSLSWCCRIDFCSPLENFDKVLKINCEMNSFSKCIYPIFVEWVHRITYIYLYWRILLKIRAIYVIIILTMLLNIRARLVNIRNTRHILILLCTSFVICRWEHYFEFVHQSHGEFYSEIYQEKTCISFAFATTYSCVSLCFTRLRYYYYYSTNLFWTITHINK